MTSYINKCVHDYDNVKAASHILHVRNSGLSLIKWEASCTGWVKLNIDGARDKDGNSGYGRIIRGSKGEWLGGFSKSIGLCNAYIAKLWTY